MKNITLVIPAYNEETNILPFYQSCKETFDNSKYEFTYIFVDDGSKDGTYSEIKKLAESNPGEDIRGIMFSRNFGKESAILAGLKETRGDYTVIIDADLQHDPKYVLEMASYLDENPDYDCVAGVQKGRRESALIKFLKRRFYRMMNSSSDTEFTEDASDFRMIKREVVEAILQLGEYHRFSKGIFSWVGFNTYYMPYTVNPRYSGKTTWTFGKLLRYGMEGVIGYSTLPLKLSTWLGLLTSLGAIIALFYTYIRTMIVGRSVPGYATIVCLILMMSGVQMLLLGIIGEYLSKTYMETKRRPIYIIKDKIAGDNAAKDTINKTDISESSNGHN